MVLMLLLQIAVVCFYFFDKSWESDLPADSTGVPSKFKKNFSPAHSLLMAHNLTADNLRISIGNLCHQVPKSDFSLSMEPSSMERTNIWLMPAGEYAKLRDIVMKHIPACKIVGLATLGLQLLSLMVSCSLYYAEGRPAPQHRLDPRALDNRGHLYHDVYETGSQQGSHAVRITCTYHWSVMPLCHLCSACWFPKRFPKHRYSMYSSFSKPVHHIYLHQFLL
jgi:hypothetical protein